MVNVMLSRMITLSKATDSNAASSDRHLGRPDDSSLMVAIERDCGPTLDKLIKAGADVNHQDISPYRSPLMVAIHNKSTSMARTLIEAGADINYDGWEPHPHFDKDMVLWDEETYGCVATFIFQIRLVYSSSMEPTAKHGV